jgi:hypothetical protein
MGGGGVGSDAYRGRPAVSDEAHSLVPRHAIEPCVVQGRYDYTSCMQTAQPTGRPQRNQGLFSDHYLNATMPARTDWRGLPPGCRILRSFNRAPSLYWKIRDWYIIR